MGSETGSEKRPTTPEKVLRFELDVQVSSFERLKVNIYENDTVQGIMSVLEGYKEVQRLSPVKMQRLRYVISTHTSEGLPDLSFNFN